MKTKWQKQYLKIVLLAWLIPLGIWLCGCGKSHKLNCIDIASHAAHSAQMRIGGPVFVAINHIHAQAYVDRGGEKCWLTIKDGFLVEDSRCELQNIEAKYPLETWDYLMREIFKWRFQK